MDEITTIGIDLAKNKVHGVDAKIGRNWAEVH